MSCGRSPSGGTRADKISSKSSRRPEIGTSRLLTRRSLRQGGLHRNNAPLYEIFHTLTKRFGNPSTVFEDGFSHLLTLFLRQSLEFGDQLFRTHNFTLAEQAGTSSAA